MSQDLTNKKIMQVLENKGYISKRKLLYRHNGKPVGWLGNKFKLRKVIWSKVLRAYVHISHIKKLEMELQLRNLVTGR